MTRPTPHRTPLRGRLAPPDPGAAAVRAVVGGAPVVTRDGDRVRVEGFSADRAVYVRFDAAGPAGFDRGVAPSGWTSAFAEVAALAPAMAPMSDVQGEPVARFLGSLPMFAAPGADVVLDAAPGRLRHALSPRTGCLLLTGSGRLRPAVRLAHLVTRLRVYRGASGATGWVVDLPGGRLTLLLSARPARGFGEDAVTDGGRVGYDLVERTWFHRETMPAPGPASTVAAALAI